MREVFDGSGRELRQDIGVIRCHFLGGESVVSRAHFVENAVDVFPGVLGGAFEHHVLKEMGDAAECIVLVASAGPNKQTRRERMRIRIFLRQNLQAVGQSVAMELQWHRAGLYTTKGGLTAKAPRRQGRKEVSRRGAEARREFMRIPFFLVRATAPQRDLVLTSLASWRLGGQFHAWEGAGH